MSEAFIPDVVARHAGLVMAHAAVIASALNEGELICPFVVVTKGEDRRSLEFEDQTQERAVERAWASLHELKDSIDLWGMAREGLRSGRDAKEDVLLVAAWTHGMTEPAVFVQGFRPRAKGGFALTGPVTVQDAPNSLLESIGDQFPLGVEAHPKGFNWNDWHQGGA
jgi:hypothetical protein